MLSAAEADKSLLVPSALATVPAAILPLILLRHLSGMFIRFRSVVALKLETGMVHV